MSTLRTSGEFHEGIHPEMLQLRNVFTKRLCFICGPCEEKCEANLLRISRNVRVHPGLKGKKKPGPKKANKDLLFGTAFTPLPRCIRIPRARFRFSFL